MLALPISCIRHASTTSFFSLSVKYPPYILKKFSAHITISSRCCFNVTCPFSVIFINSSMELSIAVFSLCVRLSSTISIADLIFLTISLFSSSDKLFVADFA